MTFDEYEKAWSDKFLARGHVFQLEEPDPDYDGPSGPKIDWFAVDGGFHNGPKCIRCGWSCCQHCTKIQDIPECTGGECDE